ncbi:MAG TPA: SLBB domain-containing protein [Sphingobacteriaceae bacterium]
MSFKKVMVLLSALVCIAVFCNNSFAQTPSAADMKNIRVDELSDDQIRAYYSQAQAQGLSDDQLEQAALAQGMNPVEVKKLRARVDKLKGQGSSTSGTSPGAVPGNRGGRELNYEPDTLPSTDPSTPEEKALRSKIFGADIFKNTNLSFEPNLRLATPPNYQVGPDDQLLIDIYGYSEASYELTVSPEGTINIPYIGVIQVGGLTVEAATAKIRSRLSTIYSGIKNGNTHVSVAIGNIRSIKVILTGEVTKPGTYTLPSLATVFNALYESGGPTVNGSFRQIEVIRGGRRLATLDLYDFLLSGQMKNNLQLRDQDVIRIPTYKKRVEVVGQVKHPGIFEMLSGETLTDLLRFTGDFNERAYQARIKVLKNTATERKIADILSTEFTAYQPESGDKFFVDEILERFENRVTINGAIFRPGQFELEPGLTLRQLIEKAEGLTEDAFQNRGYITRLGDDLQTNLVSFNVSRVLSGQDADIPLKREDVVTISSIFDLKEAYNVRVDGEVQRPGELPFAEGMSLEDAIIQAGGLKEGATEQRIEVSRRVKNSNALSTSAQTAEVYQINIGRDLKGATANFLLQPFDIIMVRPSSGYEIQRQVKVEGEVLYPGFYTITRKDERISDLVKRAGSFTALAYPSGASLKRPGASMASDKNKIDTAVENREKLSKIQRLQPTAKEAADLAKQEEALRNFYVGINLDKIMTEPGSKYDLILEEGDILRIPKQLQTVKINGEVLYPVTTVFSTGKNFKQYISQAGGFSSRSLKRRSYVIYANGAVRSTKKFLFFNNYPIIKAGAEIYVPKKEERKTSLSEIVGLSTALASLAAIIFSVLR